MLFLVLLVNWCSNLPKLQAETASINRIQVSRQTVKIRKQGVFVYRKSKKPSGCTTPMSPVEIEHQGDNFSIIPILVRLTVNREHTTLDGDAARAMAGEKR